MPVRICKTCPMKIASISKHAHCYLCRQVGLHKAPAKKRGPAFRDGKDRITRQIEANVARARAQRRLSGSDAWSQSSAWVVNPTCGFVS